MNTICKDKIIMILAMVFFVKMQAQISGEVVYKWEYDASVFGEDRFYRDTLRFNGATMLYTEKRSKQQWWTPQNFRVTSDEIDKRRYLNLKTLEYIRQKYNFDKKRYELWAAKAPAIQWTLQDEYKVIGKYKVQKATASHPKFDISFDQNYGLITAWFTTEILFFGGPDLIWGLPGLILEMNVIGKIKGRYIMESIVMKPVSELKPKEGVWIENKDKKDKGKLRELLNKEGN